MDQERLTIHSAKSNRRKRTDTAERTAELSDSVTRRAIHQTGKSLSFLNEASECGTQKTLFTRGDNNGDSTGEYYKKHLNPDAVHREKNVRKRKKASKFHKKINIIE
ncbi:hypothetical protein CEXT_239731 [Caerostris extrusa]|uniref:Uncharacterized protein n=1 Tax=Caerostris extrusa TaxID=172846 RepID=A0AAV4WEW9_CAEEX|nr:hypothetical protein CEXT_239731 [Caerostris extrusa]